MVNGVHKKHMIAVVTDPKYAELFGWWIGEKLNKRFGADSRFIASVDAKTGEILAVAALSMWTPHSVELSFATNGAKRKKINRLWNWTLFDYVFNQAGRNVIIAHVAAENVKSQALQHVWDFTAVGKIEGILGEGKDAFIYSLTKQQWLNGKWASPEEEKK